MNKWDQRFMAMARNEIATWSKDPNEGVGCLIVSPDRRQFTAGYNGFPALIADTQDRLGDRDTKNRLMVHAELNAVLNAKRDLAGWSLYVTKPPCADCCLVIVQAEIARVVRPEINFKSKWVDSLMLGQTILDEAGVETIAEDG